MYYCQLVTQTIIQSNSPFTFDYNGNVKNDDCFIYLPTSSGTPIKLSVRCRNTVFNIEDVVIFYEIVDENA